MKKNSITYILQPAKKFPAIFTKFREGRGDMPQEEEKTKGDEELMSLLFTLKSESSEDVSRLYFWSFVIV